jgi:SRSO17 transposase
VAAGHGVDVDPAQWQAGLDELLGRVARRFPRVEPRRRARAFVLGLLSELPRKNCWTIAEHAGDASPDGMQHLLARAVWDEDGVRDDVRADVVEHLGDPQAVLVVDETGDLKKGTATVGVQRQYTGTAGRIENAQVAVYLVYTTDAGHGLVDRDLYVPKGWTADPERCQAAGIPAQVGFATKPALATRMLGRALDAGGPGRLGDRRRWSALFASRAGHARPRLHGRDADRPYPPPAAIRAGQPDLQRAAAPARRACRPPRR